MKSSSSIINLRVAALFVFIIFSWGFAWPVNKVGLTYLSPAWFTSARLMIGTITMMILVAACGKLTVPKWEDMPLIAIIGLLQISIYILLANFGLTYLPAGRSSLLAYTTPLWVMPAATLFFKEEAGMLRWLGFALAVGGLLILLSPWEMDWSDKNIIFGTAMLLLASLCWAISMMCIRYMHWNKSPLELIPWQLLIATIPILIYALATEPLAAINWTPELILSLVYTGILVTGISYWVGLIVNRELPTVVVSIGFLLVPICSLITSAWYLHETVSLATISAMTLIISGLVMVVV